jgi:ketosteroid isomerase-like protein
LKKGKSMTRCITYALALTAVLAAAGCAHSPGSPTAADEAAIRQARRVQTQALARDDLETVVKYWTPDITIRRALGHPIETAAAARKAIEPTPGQNPATRMIYQRETVSVSASSNWPLAYEEGRWSGHVGNVANAPIISGRYGAQWVKRDGRWLVRSEVFVAIDCADAGCKAAALP